ncbi:hypothetical protein COLO4_01271 [Corchorus olitorius]|uniref:Uncharacterized protein n=1 Tax=Corchorus olitorius TaxID=93759 RepID=A0A1R3L2R0_9ROSI|nr:hypothetical protein COLO4_01271 [Corchorus olitorius]
MGFQNNGDSPGKVWYKARKLASEIGRAFAMRSRASSSVNRWVKWQKPPPGCFILNTDGALKNSRSRGWVEEVAIVEVKVEGEPNSSIRRTFICIYSGVLT